MIKSLYILRGLPGSGKSYEAKKIFSQYGRTLYFSTDLYWMRPDNTYDFNPKLISQAHEWNFACFERSLHMDVHNFIIDNTNTTFDEIEKYVDAWSCCHRSNVILLEPKTSWKFDVDRCAERNIHNVPKRSIQKMMDRWETSELVKEKLESTFNNIKVKIDG